MGDTSISVPGWVKVVIDTGNPYLDIGGAILITIIVVAGIVLITRTIRGRPV